MTTYQIGYVNRKGAGVIEHFTSAAKMEARLPKIHAEGVIRINGHIAGEITRLDNGRWGWWYDPHINQPTDTQKENQNEN